MAKSTTYAASMPIGAPKWRSAADKNNQFVTVAYNLQTTFNTFIMNKNDIDF